MELQINVIDAFTDAVFSGNPAAVIVTEQWLDDTVMQAIATENNLSETAFLVCDARGRYAIRWFSPLTEINFCGHATLASAYVLFQQTPEREQVTFVAPAVGECVVERQANGRLQMNFPNTQPEQVSDIPEALTQGLSIAPDEVYRNAQAYFVIYGSEQSVLKVQRDNELLKTLAPYDVVVTALAASDAYDFISRYFWPANGGDEDPVTGSIHTGLAPFWAERLHKTSLTAYQASQRGGVLYCDVKGDRVFISGHAAPYLRGTITIP